MRGSVPLSFIGTQKQYFRWKIKKAGCVVQECENSGWGHGSLDKKLALPAWGPEFKSQTWRKSCVS